MGKLGSKRNLFVLGGFALLLFVSIVKKAGANDKVDICHIPPGNPENAHTINVSVNAIPAHLAHGDSLGACHHCD